ncbi:MAG: aminoglycoside phosphotransferase family protein [Alphaproteobacteria bacterium]|nr:aminoglycoside phosphotransferase family protein [Alphaproteobacteria bacterium]
MQLKPDLQVSVATAQAIVDRVASGEAVAGVSRLHGGELAAIHEISFADPAHRPLVLKIYPDALHWKMQKEVMIAGLVRDRLSVAVPRILLADDSKTLLGLNWTLMTKLDGLVLGQIETAFTPAQRASEHRQIGRLLREFHRIAMTAFGYIGAKDIVTPHPTNHAYMTHQFQRKLREFAERGGEPALARRISGHVEARAHLFGGCTQAVLCHNDLHAGNLLASTADGDVRLTGVVDFEGALAGDPLMDVAKAAFYLTDEPRRALLDGYGPIERAHVSQTLNLYHLYFVLELWCWMAQIGQTQRLAALAAQLEASCASPARP